MRAGPTSYDIIVPTNNFIPTYLNLDLIEPLRQDLIPNLTNIDREFVDRLRPGSTAASGSGAPPGSASTARGGGAAVNSWSACSSRRRPWAATSRCCASPPTRSPALHLPRASPNSIKDGDLADVVKLVRSIKPRLKGFTTDTYIDELAANETWLAQGWSGDVFQAQDQNQDVSYTIPKEGSLRFVDVMAIPKGAPHPSRRPLHELRPHPKVQARISKYVSYGTPVAGQAAAAPGADVRPVDLPAGLDQAVDPHPHRAQAREVAGGLRRDRQVAFLA